MGGLTVMLRQGGDLRTGFLILYYGMFDPDVPRHVKLMFLLLVAYVLSPLDLIPDFIPLLGQLDEVIIVPIAIRCMVRLVPDHVRQRHSGRPQIIKAGGLQWLGVSLVVTVWIACLFSAYLFW